MIDVEKPIVVCCVRHSNNNNSESSGGNIIIVFYQESAIFVLGSFGWLFYLVNNVVVSYWPVIVSANEWVALVGWVINLWCALYATIYDDIEYGSGENIEMDEEIDW